MRIGVFGGTFDPIHNGHLVVAEECRERLNIDRVLFVPAGLPPHKQARTLTSPHHRMAMVRLAIASNPRFEASSIELGRPGPSYSVDTLRQLRQNQRDGTDVFFIMGADSLKELPSWHDPAGLIASCRLVVVSRPGSPAVDSSHLDNLYLGAKGRVTMLEVPGLDIASSDLRARVAMGRTIRYQSPNEVIAYIESNGLYRAS